MTTSARWLVSWSMNVVVDDYDSITAGALFCGVDLGLSIIERDLGADAADQAAASKGDARQGRVWSSATAPRRAP
jgi:transcriptional regulator GlxA family with amidase domain